MEAETILPGTHPVFFVSQLYSRHWVRRGKTHGQQIPSAPWVARGISTRDRPTDTRAVPCRATPSPDPKCDGSVRAPLAAFLSRWASHLCFPGGDAHGVYARGRGLVWAGRARRVRAGLPATASVYDRSGTMSSPMGSNATHPSRRGKHRFEKHARCPSDKEQRAGVGGWDRPRLAHPLHKTSRRRNPSLPDFGRTWGDAGVSLSVKGLILCDGGQNAGRQPMAGKQRVASRCEKKQVEGEPS